jgi:hypothetical protein
MSELLSLARMARRLGVMQQWLRDQADAGNVPCLKAGNRYLFNAVAVQDAVAAKAANTRQGVTDANPMPTDTPATSDTAPTRGGRTTTTPDVVAGLAPKSLGSAPVQPLLEGAHP